ncbi:hypothetical protein E1262_21535 [Jiangella aurantiaca]|uniref:DUF624 domain-containing protein n=1 Tax=Jiangella aurantiaca TaxID=2530373 RepID=A0A4R5A3T5_9ACTN|nr:hypothetical protein [Jiangella aurantiaca]TDD66598.1 hypothetical protein E1262_21535 [Jiangella aurantiaca]
MSTPRPAALTGGRLGLFADCLLAGILATVAMAGVLTAYPGFVAACATIRRRVEQDRSVGPVTFWRTFREVARSGPLGFVVPPAVAGVLGLDAVAVAAGVPGAAALLVVLVACTAAAAVLGLRAAAGWRPGRAWPAVGAEAARRAAGGIGGDLLLLLAAGCAAGIAAAVPVTALLVLGPLAVAAVAVEAHGR